MASTHSLDGDWELTYTEPGVPPSQGGGWGRWIPAVVPGDVHLDLLRAGLIPEPLASDNSTRLAWIEGKDWWYRRDVALPAGPGGTRQELVFEGLDLTADVWLNGTKVGRANNMFVAHRFDVTGLVVEGVNHVEVRLDVGLAAAAGKPVELFAKTWNSWEPKRPWLRKAQQAFYWDIAPRLLTCGIWRGVRLEILDEVVLRDVHVTSAVEGRDARVTVVAEIEVLADEARSVVVDCSIDDGSPVRGTVAVDLEPGVRTVRLELVLPEVKLWWPNGMGEAHCYPVVVELLDDRGRALGRWSVRHGVRRIELEERPMAEGGRTFTFVVNGRRAYAKGGNWVPSDAIYARTGGPRERRLLELAREANFNMIRVWGGGIYPDDAFYDSCDELGLLVWQDFMFACGYYPDFEPWFVDEVRREAELVVRRLRNHPSVALWCGNNENTEMHQRVDPEGIFHGRRLFDEVLPAVCAELDPETPYRPSSPYPFREDEGDYHVWEYTLGLVDGKPKALRLWDYAEGSYRFVSEFGVFGPSNMSSMRQFMGESPVDLGSAVYAHHRNYFEAAGVITGMLQRFYRHREHYLLDEFIVAGQMSQAEVVKYILEEFRSRMYACSGTLFWEYNDTWGHTGYSPVDYYLSVKPLYHYMRRAYAPVHVVFRDGGRRLLILNDTLVDRTLEVEHGAMTFDGHVLFATVTVVAVPGTDRVVAADLTGPLAAVGDPRAAFAYARVREGGVEIDRNRQFLVPIRDLVMPESSLETEIVPAGDDAWAVTVRTREFAWMVRLDSDDDLRYADNAFDLWPGEARTIEVRADHPLARLRLDVTTANEFFNRPG